MRRHQRLEVPILTPSTKAGHGDHDVSASRTELLALTGMPAADFDAAAEMAMALFLRGQALCAERGLILVDTKYEFGRAPDGRILLIDEVHTPDSSRFWRADTYPGHFAAGEEPENFDKEFVRLAYAIHDYRGDGDPPSMPADLWVDASQRYIAIYEMLTGKPFQPGSYPVETRLLENLRRAGILT
jgi:phosphoribosylaminoimidazole-succinocarboxamide synthase